MANFLRLERRIISRERLRATSSAVKMLAWLLMRKLLSLTHTAHVHAHGPCRTTRAHVRPRAWTHVTAVARRNANYADIAWYCAILRAVAAKIMQHHAQIKPCVAAISVSAVIEINVFDYNMHARARAQCE